MATCHPTDTVKTDRGKSIELSYPYFLDMTEKNTQRVHVCKPVWHTAVQHKLE
jgi:hypothetical protein